MLTDPGEKLALEEVVDTAIAITGADFGNVQLIDPATGHLRIVAQRGFPQWWLDHWDTVAKGHGACGAALQRAERVIVSDIERSPIFAGTPALEVQRRAGVRAVQSTPIVSRSGTPLGMFSTHFRTVHEPDERARKLLDLLARHVAELVERFRAERQVRQLNADLQRRVAEVEEARAEAERFARVKSSFLANMSHEIRTPMNAILGTAHLMRKDGLTPKQAAQIDRITQAGDHLLHIISDVLDISKIDAGKMTLEDAPFELDAVLAKVVAMVSPMAAAKGLALSTDLQRLRYAVVGDATRLTQALLNYANNAVKFTDRGSVILRCRLAEETAQRVLLRFEVEDTGIGIDPTHLERLFSVFEQADHSTTRKFGGTGLGLAITRRLAQLMGGDAGASSTPQVGSEFWFTAWFDKAEGVAPQPDRAMSSESPQIVPARDRRGLRVLLVEDDPVNQLITAEEARSTGVVVDLANDGLEAVQKAQRQPYDLVVMDVHMPRMDGLEATRRIRAIPGFATVPVIALTASGFSEDRDRCRQAGMDDFLSKPVLPDALAATLLKWLPKK
ncbi:MAG: response regulator [Pseudomonadota bacterium]